MITIRKMSIFVLRLHGIFGSKSLSPWKKSPKWTDNDNSGDKNNKRSSAVREDFRLVQQKKHGIGTFLRQSALLWSSPSPRPLSLPHIVAPIVYCPFWLSTNLPCFFSLSPCLWSKFHGMESGVNTDNVLMFQLKMLQCLVAWTRIKLRLKFGKNVLSETTF